MKTKLCLLLVAVFAVLIITPAVLAEGSSSKSSPPSPFVSEKVGVSPFWLTQAEIGAGIRYYQQGVYYFPMVGEEYRINLAMFLKGHQGLELVTSTPDGTNSYTVILRLREKK